MPTPGVPEPPVPSALVQLGWDPAWAGLAAEHVARHPGLVPGRVVRTDRGSVEVQTAAAAFRVPVAGAEVTTGDWVLVAGTGPDRALATVLPRRTALVRGAGRRAAAAQVLAANVDLVLIVLGLSTAPNLARLDRLLTLARQTGAEAVVVLTMADLTEYVEVEREEVAEAAPGTPVVVTSTVDGRGLDELRGRLAPGRTAVVLGASGAGKSSLVNALAGAELTPVGAAREDGKGRHTTVARELVVLPGLGLLLDTPGLRGVQVWDAGYGLEHVFADIEAFGRQCRFSDCGHGGEPGCAVLAAVEDGRLPARRLDSYLRLQRESAWLQSRYDARLRAEQRRHWRVVAKQARQRRDR